MWKVVNLIIPSGDPFIKEDNGNAEYSIFARPQWVGHEVLKKVGNGRVVASERINCCFPIDYFQDSTLGKGCVKVTIIEVLNSDIMTIITHQK